MQSLIVLASLVSELAGGGIILVLDPKQAWGGGIR